MKIETKKPRKKVCPKCGRKLWLRDFYRRKNGYLSYSCKECERASKNEEYRRNRKVPDGQKIDPKTGRIIEHKGARSSIYWTGNMLSLLKRHFSNTKNEEMAEMLGVSPRTVIRKARELRLEKNPVWLKGVQREHGILGHCVSKKMGYPGGFAKGHTPWNKKQINNT